MVVTMLWILIILSFASTLVGIYGCYLQDLSSREAVNTNDRIYKHLKVQNEQILKKLEEPTRHNFIVGAELPEPTLKAVHLDDEEEARELLNRWQSSLVDEASIFVRPNGTT